MRVRIRVKKKERKRNEVWEFFLWTKQKANRTKQPKFRNLYEIFATKNPTKPTPSMMKLGDNTPQDVYKHTKLEILKYVV